MKQNQLELELIGRCSDLGKGKQAPTTHTVYLNSTRTAQGNKNTS